MTIYCNNCGAKANRIKVINGTDQCSNCSDMLETGGSQVNLTRNSQRVRQQQKQYEGDMIPPYEYSKIQRKGVPNKDFIQKYPEQASKTFTTQELREVNITKLKGKT